jgi:hypothetical protein
MRRQANECCQVEPAVFCRSWAVSAAAGAEDRPDEAAQLMQDRRGAEAQLLPRSLTTGFRAQSRTRFEHVDGGVRRVVATIGELTKRDRLQGAARRRCRTNDYRLDSAARCELSAQKLGICWQRRGDVGRVGCRIYGAPVARARLAVTPSVNLDCASLINDFQSDDVTSIGMDVMPGAEEFGESCRSRHADDESCGGNEREQYDLRAHIYLPDRVLLGGTSAVEGTIARLSCMYMKKSECIDGLRTMGQCAPAPNGRAPYSDASICGLGQAAPNPQLCVLKYFPDELTKPLGHW